MVLSDLQGEVRESCLDNWKVITGQTFCEQVLRTQNADDVKYDYTPKGQNGSQYL